LVPGSETEKKLAAEVPIDPAQMEIGKAQYLVCGACHGQNGEGGPAGPPLAGSEWVTGPVSNLIKIQLRGLIGPIEVKGKVYDQFPAGMLPMAYQTDEQIAGALTYVRNSFGNKASAVNPEEVKALRDEVGKPQLTVQDLIKP
jgi:mono/diheme cytochrome c family protein